MCNSAKPIYIIPWSVTMDILHLFRPPEWHTFGRHEYRILTTIMYTVHSSAYESESITVWFSRSLKISSQSEQNTSLLPQLDEIGKIHRFPHVHPLLGETKKMELYSVMCWYYYGVLFSKIKTARLSIHFPSSCVMVHKLRRCINIPIIMMEGDVKRVQRAS